MQRDVDFFKCLQHLVMILTKPSKIMGEDDRILASFYMEKEQSILVKAVLHNAIFYAILYSLDVKSANTRFFYSVLLYSSHHPTFSQINVS